MRPVLAGMVMAPMVLWMLHDRIMGGGTLAALAAFAVAHLALVAVVGLLAARVPYLRRRLHVPSARHIAGMTAGFVVMVLAIHGAAHWGGIA